MNSSARHMVSRPVLQTTFDQKENAFELQQRLSAWSRTVMPREASAIFDALCPPEQTWRIPALTLNLGTVDFLNLEAELSIKLREQLMEELTSMVIRNDQANGALMTIADERSMQLEALSYFLTQGILPWNCPVGTSFNGILSDQLQNNPVELIKMIRSIGGGKNRVVRRRIAWQTHDTNIKKIIAGLEPASHKDVLEFSSELNRLQASRNMVPAGAAELQREIWLWVLDYLLVGRGTLFNQKELMKSSIRQMAAHYNLAYHELFNMIRAAAKSINQRQGAAAGFMAVLQALENEEPEPSADHWALLTACFSGTGSPGTGLRKNEINELVIRLARQDIDRFTRQMAAIAGQTNGWHPAMNALDGPTLGCLFSAVAGTTHAAGWQEVVDFLASLSGKYRRQVWQAGFRLLTRYQNTSPDAGGFLHKLLEELKKDDRTALLLRTEMVSVFKTPANLEVYRSLCNQAEPGFIKALLDELYRLLKATSADQKRLIAIQEQLAVFMNLNPKAFAGVLSVYRSTDRLKVILPYLNGPVLKDMVYTAFPVLTGLAAILNRWKDHPLYGEITRLCLDNLPVTGLEQALSGDTDLLQRTLAGLFYLLPVRLNEPAEQLKDLLGSHYQVKKELPAFAEAMTLAGRGDIADRDRVISLLRSAFNDRDFTWLRVADPGKARQLLNYLIPGSALLIGELAPDRELFWRSVLDKADSRSGLQVLIRDYKNAARLHLAIPAWIRTFENQATRNPALKDMLDLDPATLRALIAGPPADKLTRQLNRSVSFTGFAAGIAADLGDPLAEAARSYHSLYLLAAWLSGNNDLPRPLRDLYWKNLLETIRSGVFSSSDWQSLVNITFDHLVQEQFADATVVLGAIKDTGACLTKPLISALAAYHPAFRILKESVGGRLETVAAAGLLYTLSLQLILNREVPDWYNSQDIRDAGDLLSALLTGHPEQFFKVIKYEAVTERSWEWLHRTLSFDTLTRAMGKLQPNKQTLLDRITGLYKALGQLSVNGVAPAAAQYFLYKRVIGAWRTGDWAALSAGNIWNELLWDIGLKKGVKSAPLLEGFHRLKLRLPPALQVSIPALQVVRHPSPVMRLTANKIGEAIPVPNAGLVLLNSYIPLLLERLALTNNSNFLDGTARGKAVHYLQYLVTGQPDGIEETLLSLNKVLCGLELKQPVPYQINMPDEHKILIDGLVETAIVHWGSSIGETTPEGFRGGWLVRDGLLTKRADKWELAVEKRAYDLLLYHSPYSFTIINYPWMNKPLYVSWPY